jgi:DNA-binding response OmpR family regulator
MLNKTILFIDDERDFAEGLSLHCRHVGLQAQTAGNALTAINYLTEQTPDIVCLDVNMPTGNGLDICEFLKSKQSFSNVPVIILTGAKDNKTILRCKELNAYYMQKSPDLWKRMRPVIEELLNVSLPEGSSQLV